MELYFFVSYCLTWLDFIDIEPVYLWILSLFYTSPAVISQRMSEYFDLLLMPFGQVI